MFRKRRKKESTINPEDIFTDSINLPGFSRERKQGAMEASLGKTPGQRPVLGFVEKAVTSGVDGPKYLRPDAG